METQIESKPNLADELRDNRRIKLKEHQEFNRLKAFDSHRFVDSEVLTEKDIAGLCSRIKRRKHASEEDLRKLSNAFIQSEANIAMFIKTTGAINIIIKEFTGSDRCKQLFAAQCLCNLSLGDEICCSKVATFAGSYLMIFIMKSNDATLTVSQIIQVDQSLFFIMRCFLLQRICLWITQNIVAAGSKAMNILLSQELLKNCLHILNESAEQEVDAVQLLDIIVDGKFGELDFDEKQQVKLSVWNLLKKRFNDPLTLQVFFKVTLLDGSWFSMSCDDQSQLLKLMTRNLKDETMQATDEHVLYFTIKILVAAQKQDPEVAVRVIELLMELDVKLSSVINNAVAQPKLFNVVKELLHFTSLLLSSSSQSIVKYFTFDPTENIRIPKLFEF